MKILLLSLCSLLMVSCTRRAAEPVKPEPIARGAEVCRLDPASCEATCASCADKAACFANGGECKAGEIWFNDTGDIAADIWTPGCHYEYPNQQCVSGTFFLGDVCSSKSPVVLIEWTVSVCHPPQGDREAYDCDKECLRVQRGHGTCVVIPNACANKPSAFCRCEKPGPNG
jgi:hypothetical protein